jgi:hypothetical protein
MAEKDGKSRVTFSGTPGEVADGFEELAEATSRAAHARGGIGRKRGGRPSMGECYADPGVTIVARRTNPRPGTQIFDRQTGMNRALISEAEISTPCTEREIKDTLRSYGGIEWRIEAFFEDQKLNGTTLKIKGPPRPVFEDDGFNDPAMQAAVHPMMRGAGNPWGGSYPGGQMGGMGFPGMGADPRFMFGGRDEWDDDDDDKPTPEEQIALDEKRLEFEAKKRRMERDEREDRDASRGQATKELFDVEFGKLKDTIKTEMERLFGDVGKIRDEVLTEVRRTTDSQKEELRSVKDEVKDKFGEIDKIVTEFKHSRDLAERDSRQDRTDARRDIDDAVRRVESSTESKLNEIRSTTSSALGEIKLLIGTVKDGSGKEMLSFMNQNHKTQSDQFGRLNDTMLKLLGDSGKGQSSIDQFTNAFASMASIMGMGPESKDPWVIAAEGIKDGVTEVAKYLGAKREAGQAITQESVDKKIEEVVKSFVPEAMSGMQQTVRDEIGKRVAAMGKKLPAPPPPAAEAPATTPPATPPAAAPAPEGVAPETELAVDPQAEAKAKMEADTQEQWRLRVNGLLDMIIREAAIEPEEAELVEYGLAHLPRQLLLNFMKAKSPEEIGAMVAEHGDQEYLNALLPIINDPGKKRWVAIQLREMLRRFRDREAARAQATKKPPTPPAKPPAKEAAPPPAPAPAPPPAGEVAEPNGDTVEVPPGLIDEPGKEGEKPTEAK